MLDIILLFAASFSVLLSHEKYTFRTNTKWNTNWNERIRSQDTVVFTSKVGILIARILSVSQSSVIESHAIVQISNEWVFSFAVHSVNVHVLLILHRVIRVIVWRPIHWCAEHHTERTIIIVYKSYVIVNPLRYCVMHFIYFIYVFACLHKSSHANGVWRRNS